MGLPTPARRGYWSRRTARLDPVRDCVEIVRILSQHEFPWDINQALSFALFRTYAVPSIGRLLYGTGEFTQRPQKRYDDTVVLLDHVLEHGLDTAEGRAAVRRINRMHAMYAIADDDMRYVLSTFVVMPSRWLDDFGWRPLTDAERRATTEYYRALGHHLGIRGLPATYDGFEQLLEDHERARFGFDEGARAVADATLDLMTTFPPNHLAPRRVVRRFSYALMDEPLLDAFRYPHPTPAERAAARAAMRARAGLLRWAPPRMQPRLFRDLPSVRGYRDGYRVDDLGTFAPAGPAAYHRRPPAAPPAQPG